MKSECSGEPAHLHSLARMLSAHNHTFKFHMGFCLAISLYMFMFVGYSLNKSYLIFLNVVLFSIVFNYKLR